MALFRGHTSPFMTLGHTFINFEGGKMQPCSLSTFPIGDGQSLFVRMLRLTVSDESEPSWLEPELELKDFQLGSARDLFPFSSKSKIGRKQAETFIFFKFSFTYVAKS